ncbi:MAG: response regulator [Acidimicrobiia bacterium]|nr:response regulator [Acidimicrobiia bacterium]MYC44059.1 response regulator [Acidimicrobiia bacterium]
MSEVEALRARLERLVEASLRINDSLDFDEVLQGVLDSARSLTGAERGIMLLYDERGWIVDYVSSGGTPEQADAFWSTPNTMAFHRHMTDIDKPVRLKDFQGYLKEQGLPEIDLPFPASPSMSLLTAPIYYRGERCGALYVVDKERGFSADDEEMLVMFASQAALVISNARRHREERQARADLESLVSMVPVGVVVFDAETGLVRSANREVRKIVSELQPRDDSGQEPLDEAVCQRAGGRAVRGLGSALADAVRSGETVLAEEITIEGSDGRCVNVLVSVTSLRTEAGEVESLVATLQDMKQFEELDRLRTEFLGMIGHELRAPLAAIKGSATTLLDSAAPLYDAEVSQYHRIINEHADNMRHLIGDLIDVACIETGTLSVNPETVAVPELLDEARNAFSNADGRDNVRITLPPDVPMVLADRRRIAQVLGNLLANAARNSHAKSPIRISAAIEDLHVAVSVADDGVGLPAERLAAVFDKFSRPDGADRSRDLGLGLAICKGIVEAHGGRIWAESDGPGLGARFTFTVPIAERAPAARGRLPASTRGQHSGAKTRVLVVDDDPRTLKSARDALKVADCEPTVTADPGRVAALIEDTKPHVVLLDLMLPGTDGFELMQEILAIGDVPVIFLSAYDQDQVIAQAFAMGAVDYIVKPFSPTELAARVNAALRKKAEMPTPFTLGELTINYTERAVTVGGRPVELTPTEFRLLTELSTNAGTALTHDQLLQRVWGPGQPGDARPMRTVIKNLRRKLGEETKNPTYVLTVPRVGYRMRKPDTPTQ